MLPLYKGGQQKKENLTIYDFDGVLFDISKIFNEHVHHPWICVTSQFGLSPDNHAKLYGKISKILNGNDEKSLEITLNMVYAWQLQNEETIFNKIDECKTEDQLHNYNQEILGLNSQHKYREFSDQKINEIVVGVAGKMLGFFLKGGLERLNKDLERGKVLISSSNYENFLKTSVETLVKSGAIKNAHNLLYSGSKHNKYLRAEGILNTGDEKKVNFLRLYGNQYNVVKVVVDDPLSTDRGLVELVTLGGEVLISCNRGGDKNYNEFINSDLYGELLDKKIKVQSFSNLELHPVQNTSPGVGKRKTMGC